MSTSGASPPWATETVSAIITTYVLALLPSFAASFVQPGERDLHVVALPGANLLRRPAHLWPQRQAGLTEFEADGRAHRLDLRGERLTLPAGVGGDSAARAASWGAARSAPSTSAAMAASCAVRAAA